MHLPDTMVGRADSIAADGTGPIYVATRNDALGPVIDKCPGVCVSYMYILYIYTTYK